MDYNTNEKERTKEYKQIVSAGDPKQLAGIMKMVYIQNKERSSQGKKSAAVDDKYCKIAEHLLYTELGLALDKNEREIGGIMRCAIRK
jgi:CarD family transcriptional regulator